MINMLILIPLSYKQTWPKECEEFTRILDGNNTVITVMRGGVNSLNEARTQNKIDGMNASRNACVYVANRATGHEFVCMQDGDCIHLHKDNLTAAEEYLRQTGKNAVALPWKHEHSDHNHVRCLAAVFTYDAFINLKFTATLKECSCRGIKRAIPEYDYLPGIKRVKEFLTQS